MALLSNKLALYFVGIPRIVAPDIALGGFSVTFDSIDAFTMDTALFTCDQTIM